MRTASAVSYGAHLTPDGDYYVVQIMGDEGFENIIFSTKDGKHVGRDMSHYIVSHIKGVHLINETLFKVNLDQR